MRRFATLGAAIATTLALVGPTLSESAQAAPVASSAHHATVDRSQAKAAGLKLKRKVKGVQPGIAKEVITALPGKGAKGKVKFTLKGTGLKQSKKVKVKNGKATFKVPPLGTGSYKVKASFNGRKGKTKFQVFDSALTVNATTFTVSVSNPTFVYPQGPLTGSVRYKNKTATEGYVDLYKDGNVKGGEGSPDFLGFGTVGADGTFNYETFGDEVADKYAPGTYTFQAYYTPTPSFADYISSNFITVTVVP